MARGFSSFIGFGSETVWGTAVAATQYLEAMSESIITTKDRFPVKNLVGRTIEPDDEGGVNHHAGDISMMGHPVNLGIALRGAFGVSSASVVLSGFLFNNVFIPAQNDWGSKNALPSYTIEAFRDVTSSDRFAGAQFNMLQLGVQPNQDLRITLGVIAKTHDIIQQGNSNPTMPTSPLGPFKFDTASLSIDGLAVDRFEGFNFTIDNGLTGLPALNLSTDVARIHRTNAPTMRFTGQVALSNYQDYLDFVAETERRFVMSLTKAPSFQIILDLPRILYTAHPHNASGRDRIIVPITGMARYHAGSGTSVKVTMTDIRTYA